MNKALNLILTNCCVLLLLALVQLESSEYQELSDPTQTQETGYLKKISGNVAIEITYQRLFVRGEDKRNFLKKMNRFLELLNAEYYGNSDGGLLRASDISSDTRIDCFVAVSFTGFSYLCREQMGTAGDPDKAVEDILNLLASRSKFPHRRIQA